MFARTLAAPPCICRYDPQLLEHPPFKLIVHSVPPVFQKRVRLDRSSLACRSHVLGAQWSCSPESAAGAIAGTAVGVGRGDCPFLQAAPPSDNIRHQALLQTTIDCELTIEEVDAHTCRQTLEGDVTIKVIGLGHIAESIICSSLKDVYSGIPQIVERCADSLGHPNSC